MERKRTRILQLCSAGVTFINEHKKESKRFLEIFENRLKKREGIVMPLVFLGATAKNMNKRDANLDLISDKIIALTESADPVFQNKLGRYISRLLIFFEDPCKVVETMVQRALDEKDLSIVRAKCYSAAGIVRGLGVTFVDKLDIFGKILAITSSADKKDLKKVPKNQRYFIAYILSALLEYFGRVFEPKLVEILPSLMKLFGDGDEELRDLSISTLNVAMKKLSGYGVKRILPDLVEGCNDTNTRSKLASLTALGSIAYCGAKQLAASLPDIVPQLTQATIDTNPQIKEASVKSLNQLLSTIKTPEIVDIRDTLINALSRPYDENGRALEILLNTQFSHLFDTSSIALVMPIIIYGLKNNVDNKQREDAAKVVANISNLVKEPEDIVVYLKSLTDSLIVALADILPEVRATAAKAIGRITQKLGLANSEHLIQTLVKVIESEQSTAIGRTGCAQALCEALYNLGLDQIELNFSNIVAKAVDKRDWIREGYLGMLVFLPLVLDQNYERYISQTLRAAIESIAHTSEGIRNLAIKTVKTIIQKFAEKNMSQILKSLFDGMFSDSGLKRNSSVILLGDVIDGLFKEVGSQKERIFEANPEIFAALYIVKNDENPDVKYSTNNIWKSFVDNTKVVLKRIYPILTQNLLDLLVSGIKYHDEIARLTMQVFIGKYGDVFIGDIVELFKAQIAQKNPKVMKGICLYLGEVFPNFNPSILTEKRKRDFEELQMMLLNSPESNVWEAAIVCIQEYYRLAKEDQYVRDTLLTFQEDLNKADDDDSSPDFGKKIKVFGSVVKLGIAKLNIYIESLIFTTPLKPWQMEVIQNSSEIFGLKLFEKGPLKMGLSFFEEQYVHEFHHAQDKGQMLLQTIKGLAKSLTQQNEGPFVTQAITMLKKYLSNREHNLCLALLSLEVLSQFYEYNCQDSVQYLGNLLEFILPLLADTTTSNQAIFDSVSVFFKTKLGILSKAECAVKIETVRDTLTSIYEKGEHKIPGLLHRGAFDTLFQFISSTISVGDRKICATALECADILIDVASVAQLQDYSTKFLGLLIRVANYRHEEATKALIMDRVATIIKKVNLDGAQDNQLCTLLVYLLSEKHEEDGYKTSLANLIAAYQTKAQDSLAIIKRWAKRCAGDDRYPLSKLLDYIKSNPTLSLVRVCYIDRIK